MIAALLLLSVASTGVITTPPPAAAEAPGTGLVLINELANGGPRSDADGYVELRNWGDTAVDLSGWNLYRCSAAGLRANVGREEADLDSVVLQPGEIFTASKAGMPGDDHFTQPYALGGFGLYLESPDRALADAVGVYPNEPWPTTSECTTGANLPNTLDFAADESWQRVAATGDVSRDFVVAAGTPGAPNATAASPTADAGVVISEFAPAGPRSGDDEFLELLNLSGQTADLGGWQLFRCTASGRVRPDTLQLTIDAGTRLKPGARLVIGGPGFAGEASLHYARELADLTAGALLRTADGLLVDRIATTAYADSACQDQKLPAVLDAVAAESYQLGPDGFIVAPRTPGRASAAEASSVWAQPFAYAASPRIAISEFATDPSAAQLPAGAARNNFVELANYGPNRVDIGGYTIRRCEQSGARSRELQVTVPRGTVLERGDTFVAAREGTRATADAHYATSLNFLGAGVWVADRSGERVDSVGAYAMNEMDASLVTASPCTKGVALAAFAPDRMLGESYQRTRFTGVDDDDFVTAPATPGEIDHHEWVDPTARVTAQLPLAVDPVLEPVAEEAPTGDAVTVLAAYSGVHDVPLTTRTGESETLLQADAPAASVDDAWGYPYQRFVIDAEGLVAGQELSWTGSSTGRNEVQLRVWSAAASAWRTLDAGTGVLTGALAAGDLAGDTVTLLAQNGPRTRPTLAAERDGRLENPDDYDLAISHITDTQYLTETYPRVYAEAVSWIADNAADRKIAFATHTGDLVQNWVDPNQDDTRARREFERASAVQGILDDAGVPNSVLPGNHDNKRGVSNDLFNEYFPPSRYAAAPAYGGSIAPDDNSANFSTFTRGGADFLMLSLPYAYGEEEIEWASGVVTAHPGHNVVVSTHEHVSPKMRDEKASRSVDSRWVSRAGELWERVIAPNRNVVVVLSGHFHGIGKIVTENAGGIPGHDVVELLADYQEFRTHSGERATGFQRLLQIDLQSSTVAVDTFSVRLEAAASHDYDYPQFEADTGRADSISNARPWRLVEAGVQGRYTAADDEFAASAGFQYEKRVDTESITVAPAHDAPAVRASGR